MLNFSLILSLLIKEDPPISVLKSLDVLGKIFLSFQDSGWSAKCAVYIVSTNKIY